MIVTDGLTKVYRGFRTPEVRAAVDLSFEVRDGDIFGFLGPNGAGKTTTIQLLTTILHPTSGTAQVAGYDIVRDPIRVKEHVGLMPEQPGFYYEMRALDLLDFYARFYGIRTRRRRRCKETLDRVGLGEVARRRVRSYSHGMRKRLALATALIHDPPLLILDEPTGGLDPRGTAEFRALVRRLNKEGHTVFLSSHILPEVEEVCTRVGIMHRGNLVAVDRIDALRSRLRESLRARLTVRAEGVTSALWDRVKAVDGVLAAERNDGTLRLEHRGDADVAAAVNRILVDGGARVRALVPEEPDLEEIFLQLTGGV